jgi:type IV secretory pathway VirB10-like protein
MTPSDEPKSPIGETKPTPTETPTGIDLRPEPKPSARISRRAGALALGIFVLILLGFAWGGLRRSQHNQQAARDAGLPRAVTPAKPADQLIQAHPAAKPQLLTPAQLAQNNAGTPGAPGNPAQIAPCGTDATGQPIRYNPQTGQPCNAQAPVERVVVRQAPPAPRLPKLAAFTAPPQDAGREAAWQLEQEAMNAPTATKAAVTPTSSTASLLPAALTMATDPAAQIAAVGKALGLGANLGNSGSAPTQQTEYEVQNGQAVKKAFLQSQHNTPSDDYLHSLRQAPLSRFEVKAGTDIPGALEQDLNSDLPGDLKALVSQNVYDTGTGQYLLIPQGARLIGRYDSNITYGQEGVEVAWNRIIFPDMSSINLDGMMGLDSHGQAGLRDQTDHHYKRLIGMSVLTSMLMAAFAISQNHTESVLAYPSAATSAEGAIGQSLAMDGAQITRRNLNVQPTIKVRAGYQFTVRVNKDMLFETPYTPQPAQMPGGGATAQRTTFRSRDTQ